MPTISAVPLTHPALTELVAKLDAWMTPLYPPASNHCLPVSEMQDDVTWAWLAMVDDQPVGCACLSLATAGIAEIKRVYVDESQRGSGIARQLMETLEAQARQLGEPTIYLETGIYQPAAIRLYEKMGFHTTAPFGHYQPDPLSVFMMKPLIAV